MRELLETTREQVTASVTEARERVASRLCGPMHSVNLQSSAARAEMLAQRNHVRRLLAGGTPRSSASQPPGKHLSSATLHVLDRLLSYIRHSVVRVCFYNLKLFCPSLVDEYDDEVKEQVLSNLRQLPAVERELADFFAEGLDGGSIGDTFPSQQRAALDQLQKLRQLAKRFEPMLSNALARRSFAQEVPALIDAVMEALQGIHKSLDEHRRNVAELVDEAVRLTEPLAREAGLKLFITAEPTPRVFADAGALRNCFIEVISNAAKYAGGARLDIMVRPHQQNGQWVSVSFADNGRGMSEDELATCLHRGVSKGGTGEGLPMVVQVVEGEHLGRLEIDAAPDKGCTVRVLLPVKLNMQTKGAGE